MLHIVNNTGHVKHAWPKYDCIGAGQENAPLPAKAVFQASKRGMQNALRV